MPFALSAVIRHTNNFEATKWLGRSMFQNIADAWALQEALVQTDAELVVETGTYRGGSSYFIGTLFDLLGRGTVITIDHKDRVEFRHPRVEYWVGSSTSLDIRSRLAERVAEIAPRTTLVLLDSDHSADHVLAELRSFCDLVTTGSLLVVQDGVIDKLPLRRFRAGRPGPHVAIERFLKEDSRFHIDTHFSERFLFHHSPDGFLRKA